MSLRVLVICALGLVGALSGSALGQTRPAMVTLPTITIPTLPLPLPAPPAPLPPPPPTPVHVPAPPAPWPTGGIPQAAPQGSPTPVAPSSGSARQRSAQPVTAERRNPPAKLKRLRASETRVARGRASRSATLISFWLSEPAKVVFLVRDAGDCSAVGRFPVQARAGRNEVRFTGRLGDRRLAPGNYTISPERIGKSEPNRRPSVEVVVGPRGSTPARGEASTCAAGGQEQELTASAILSASASPPSEAGPSGPERRKAKKRDKGVLGVFKVPEIPRIPTFTSRSAEALPWLLGFGALALLVVSGAAIFAYVVGFLRHA